MPDTHYTTVSSVKDAMRINYDSDDDLLLTANVEAASRMIDGYCSRHFYADDSATARIFRASDCSVCHTDDISTTTGLVVETDTTGSGTFDVTWASTDYQLEPLNGRRSGQAWPYHTLRAVASREWPLYGSLSRHEALVRVTATWGWAAVPEPVAQACLIQAISLAKSKDAPLGFAGFGDMGALRMSAALHPTARTLLQPFRKHAVKVA